MRAYDAAIFDLDGTLLDTSEGIRKSIAYAIEELGLSPLSDEVIRTFIGPPIQRSFARVYGMDKKEADAAAAVFRDRYKGDDLLLAKPYDGMIETLRTLRDNGVATAVATYKRQDYAQRLLSHYGFDKVSDAIFGSDFEGVLTKKDIIENAINAVSSDRSRVVMIGDSDNDAEGAAQADVSFIGVTYGFGFAAKEDIEKYPHVFVADTPKDIAGFIL